MIPLFYSKKRELITRDNPGRSSDAFFHLFAKGAQVLNAGPRGGGLPHGTDGDGRRKF